MGKGGRLLAVELGVSMAIVIWGAARRNFWPWPPSINRTLFAYGILGVLAVGSEELAALFGAGFLLAQIVKTPVDENGYFKFIGGIPPQAQKKEGSGWYYLSWGSDPEILKQNQADKSISGAVSKKGLQPITDTPTGPVTLPAQRDGSIPIQA
jgi:hypothetical protein